ncbi:MAG TPA: two-component regulator propeller domain-containing protein [Opitutaceae bacterium]|nr:two-component regulator propeller domain-containing protein [Opitutaceae bacterium]
MAAVLTGAAAAEPFAPPSYTLREWHEEEGLPTDELAAVVQDQRGFLWVATDNEVTRFDGTTFERVPVPFETYTRAMARVQGMPAFPATRPGASNLREAGVVVHRNSAWLFEREERLDGKQPRSVFAGPKGTLWIGCEDGTVLRRQGEDVVVFEVPADLPGRKIPVFATDSNGQVWIVRSNRLNRVEGTVLSDVTLPLPEPELRIVSSASGGIWVVTRTALLRWNGSTLAEILRLPDLVGAHFVQAVHEDRHRHLWIGTRSQGLFRVKDGAIEQVPSSSEDVTGICEDTDGNIWAATNGGGLSRLRPKAHQLFDQTSGLKDNFSYTVAEDATGTMWLANRDGGMARIKDGVVDPVSRRAGWRAFSTMSVFPASNGWVWLTTGLGVYRTNPEAPQTAMRFVPLASLRNVRATFVARNGDYWLSADPDRVARWRDDQLATFGAESGFEGREVRAFGEDSTGRIWLGAADGRLFRSNGDRFERVAFSGSGDCGALQVIRFEPDGSVLVGTTRRGVVVFPAGDFSRPRFLDSARGLPGSNISQILTDDFDRYWFASRTGIFWVPGRDVRDFGLGRVDDVHAIPLGKDDGLPYLSCLGLFQPAAWKARNGTLWFATRRGVLRTDPAMMGPAGESPPPISISSIEGDGVALPLQAELPLQSTVRKIQIRLSALNLSAPESVQVRFRLEGFDTDWTVLGADRVVTYPRLPPGRYVFSTMASNGSGAWSSQPAQLTLVVSPPWWQRDWARLLYFFALLAIVVAAVRKWSHRRLRLRVQHAEQAHAIEHERARIARNIHDDVGASLTRISLLTQFAQQESPAPSPTLEKIYAATHAITRSMDEIVWAVNPRHDNTESLVYYVGNFAQSFLGSAGIRCRLESPGMLPEATLTSQIRHHLFLCCKEALHNVVKHARATEATIRITIEGGSLTIAISDNGRGVAASDSDGPRDRHPTTSGNGLRNMQERMLEIRGTCTVATEPGGGTLVTFTVPLQTAPAA